MAKAPSAFISAEKALTRVLALEWVPIHKRWIKEVTDLAAAGDIRGAEEAIADLSADTLLARAMPKSEAITRLSYRFGATRISRNGRLKSTPESDSHLDDALELYHSMVARHAIWAKLAATTALEKLERGEFDKQKADAAVIRDFVSFAETNSKNAGLNSLQLGAGLHNSRVATYGYLTEARYTGVVYYSINAVLDDRTSDFCRAIHGKTFPVEQAYDRVVQVMRLSDAADLKAVSPFPSQDADSIAEIESLDTQALIDRGLSLPPYHPYCRTYIDKAENIESLTVDTGAATSSVTVSSGSRPTPEADDLRSNTIAELASVLGLDPDILEALPAVAYPGVVASALARGTAGTAATTAGKLVPTSIIPLISQSDVDYVRLALARGDDPIYIVDALGLSMEQFDVIRAVLDAA